MNDAPHPNRKERARAFLALLYRLFPKAFFPPHQADQMVPLPANTPELLGQAFPEQERNVIRTAWEFYWKRRVYYEAVIRNTRVYDLNGTVIDNVSPEFKQKCQVARSRAMMEATKSNRRRA